MAGNGTAFLDLTDTPSSYSGEGEKCVAVNAGETALEFVECGGCSTFLCLTDTPANYTDDAQKIVRVNDAEDALQFGGDVLFGNNEKIYWELAGGGSVAGIWLDTGDNLVINTANGEKILFKVNGSQVGQFRETGKFGIGVTPAYHLDILEDSGDAQVRVRSSSGGDAEVILDCADGYDDYIYFKEAGAQTWRLGAALNGDECFELYSYDGAGQMLKVVDAGGGPSFTFYDSVFIDAPLTIDYDGNMITFEEQGTGNDIAFNRSASFAPLRLMEKISGDWKHIWQAHIQTEGTAHPVFAFDAGEEYTYSDLHCYSTDHFRISAYGDIKLIANDGNPGGYIVFYSVKVTTGDPTGEEGMVYFNVYDDVMRTYIDGQWRTIFSW